MKTLPKVSAENLNSTVMPTLIDACNSHLENCKVTGRSGDFVQATGAIFDYAETLGFSSALYYLCGTNIEQKFIDGEHWKNWPFGRSAVEDLNTHGEILRLMVLRVIKETTGHEIDKSEPFPDQETKGALPAFTADGRADATKIFGSSLASYLRFLQDEVYKASKLSKTSAEKAIWIMLRLRYLIGFIDGIAYANPEATKSLMISWFIKSNNTKVTDKFDEVVAKIKTQSEAAGFTKKILENLSRLSRS